MANVLEIIIQATDKASSVLKGISGNIQVHAAQIQKAGMVMTAFGAATVGGLTLMVKAAAEEEAGIEKLRVALANVGISYDEVKNSLEGAITATLKKTSVADDAQREALAQLTAITGNYQKSLNLLPIALDLAAGKGMGLVTSAEIIGKVSKGNTSILQRYGIVLKEGTSATKALGEIQRKFAGQAEAYGKTTAGQFMLLKYTIEDFTESLGRQLLPIIRSIFLTISPLVDKIIDWIEKHSELTKVILIVAGALGILATTLGPILIALPGIIALYKLLAAAAAALGISVAALGGWVALIIAAIIALIGIGVLLILNWETVKAKTIEIWEGIRFFFWGFWLTLTDIFKKHWDIILAILVPFIGIPILIARNWGTIVDFFKGIWEKITGFFETGINWIIDKINWLIDQLNKLPFINIGKIGLVGFKEVPLPKFQYGGVVPGPLGQPTPIIAHGGEMFLGENRAMGGVTVNVTVQGSVIAERDLTEVIRQQLYDIRRHNVSLEMA